MNAPIHCVEFIVSTINFCDMVDWACDLLVHGFDSYHLRILAGKQLPEVSNGFDERENVLLITKVLAELDCQERPITQRELVLYYLEAFLAKKILNGDLVNELHSWCTDSEYDEQLYPFYLLCCERDLFGYDSPPRGTYYSDFADFHYAEPEVLEQIFEAYVLWEVKKLKYHLQASMHPLSAWWNRYSDRLLVVDSNKAAFLAKQPSIIKSTYSFS